MKRHGSRLCGQSKYEITGAELNIDGGLLAGSAASPRADDAEYRYTGGRMPCVGVIQ
ncbi:MAG: hypothetical protein R3F38_15180 [Gammaproteobacteria bacterium]